MLHVRVESFSGTCRDIEAVARIAAKNFSGMSNEKRAKIWVLCNYKAFPRMQYYVLTLEGQIIGYILWLEKGGFRDEAVIELEQIVIEKEHRHNGFATMLIVESLEKIKKYIKVRGSTLKSLEVTTGIENEAQKLYEKALGAKVEATIKDLFRGDEVIMIARFPTA